MIWTAVEVLKAGTDVVLDFGFWGRDERASLNWLARSVGADCEVVYLEVDRRTQLERIGRRSREAPHETYRMSEEEVNQWRAQFEAPGTAELAGDMSATAPPGWSTWASWIADRWPTSTE